MGVIMHIHKAGERCKRPSIINVTAGDIKAGNTFKAGDWQVWYSPRAKAYRITGTALEQRLSVDRDIYEFHNFNCAAAKLAELGGVA